MTGLRPLTEILRDTLKHVEESTDTGRDDPAFVGWRRSVLLWIAELESGQVERRNLDIDAETSVR